MNEQVDVAVPRDRAGEFVVRIAEAIGARVDASTVFLQPVSQNGTTVIPVSQAWWGFGGGRVDRKAESTPAESAIGGGGGAIVRPVGYIVLRNGEANYHRITSLPALLLAALAGAAVAMLVARRS